MLAGKNVLFGHCVSQTTGRPNIAQLVDIVNHWPERFVLKEKALSTFAQTGGRDIQTDKPLVHNINHIKRRKKSFS